MRVFQFLTEGKFVFLRSTAPSWRISSAWSAWSMAWSRDRDRQENKAKTFLPRSNFFLPWKTCSKQYSLRKTCSKWCFFRIVSFETLYSRKVKTDQNSKPSKRKRNASNFLNKKFFFEILIWQFFTFKIRRVRCLARFEQNACN